MVRLIQKTGYIKGGGTASGYLEYVATREGVEIVAGAGDPTTKQKQLIQNILRDFPDSKDLFEYADYLEKPSIGSASAFISTALDYNAEKIQSKNIYMKYIATRPGAEKHGEHGLFGSSLHVDMDAAMWMLQKHEGNVWTFIFSLRREEAEKLGYASAEKWQRLLSSHQMDFASALGIAPEHLHWYAAFHDTETHPHVHMMVWSSGPTQGYLTPEGVTSIRSVMTNDIFKDELTQLYEQKDISYKELRAAAQNSMRELITQMEHSICSSPVIEQHMAELVQALAMTSGKKQYGYLKKPVKRIVDTIVDELARQPEVAQCYEMWNRLRDELEGYYKDVPREHLLLSQQKEFRAIKNMVIQEAENIRLGVQTYEDEQMKDELESDIPISEIAEPDTRPLRETLYEQVDEPNSQPLIVERLEQLWRRGYPAAAHMLGKLYRDGQEVPQDMEKAVQWFTISAQAGNNCSEYTLGKIYLSQGKIRAGLGWMLNAANHGNSYAMYRIGKELLTGEHLERDHANAVSFFEAAAQSGNQYAQYALGKLRLQGREIPQDKEEALRWLELSAAQGNPYAQYLIDHADDGQDPSILLSTSRLLHHMSRIFRDNSEAPANPQGLRIDSHRRRYFLEKRIVMGHKPDDHEEYVPTQNWQQTM